MNKFIFLSFLVGVSPVLSAEGVVVPKADGIFTIAVQPGSGTCFTPESLRDRLSKFTEGSYSDIGFIVGDDRVWQNGVIVLKDKTVLFWATDRDSFLRVTNKDDVTSYWIDREKLVR